MPCPSWKMCRRHEVLPDPACRCLSPFCKFSDWGMSELFCNMPAQKELNCCKLLLGRPQFLNQAMTAVGHTCDIFIVASATCCVLMALQPCWHDSGHYSITHSRPPLCLLRAPSEKTLYATRTTLRWPANHGLSIGRPVPVPIQLDTRPCILIKFRSVQPARLW